MPFLELLPRAKVLYFLVRLVPLGSAPVTADRGSRARFWRVLGFLPRAFLWARRLGSCDES